MLRSNTDHQEVSYPKLDAEPVATPSAQAPAQQEDDLVILYKADRTKLDRKLKLLSIMDTNSIDYLREFYLAQMNAIITQMDEARHPAAAPARELVNEIRAKKLPDSVCFEIMHRSIDLASTKPDQPEFTQKSEQFTNSMAALKKDMTVNFVVGAVKLFVTALAVGAAVALNFLVGGITTGTFVGIGIGGAFASLSSIGNFIQGTKDKSMLNKMRLFDQAMHAHETEPAQTLAPTIK